MAEDWKVYVFHPKYALSKCLDFEGGKTEDGTNLIIWDYHRSHNQRFQAISVGNGYFTFKNLQTGKVIDETGGEVKNEVNIQMYSSNNTDAQKWKIIKEGGGYYSIQSKLNSNYYLDIQYASNKNGANVILYERMNSDNQKFKIIEKKYIDIGLV